MTATTRTTARSCAPLFGSARFLSGLAVLSALPALASVSVAAESAPAAGGVLLQTLRGALWVVPLAIGAVATAQALPRRRKRSGTRQAGLWDRLSLHDAGRPDERSPGDF